MTWDPITQPCDYFTLGGVKSPGLAEIKGASSPRKWDEREGYGFGGAYIVFKGRGLARFTAYLKLSTVEHWAEWSTFKRIVDKLPKRRFGEGGKDSGNLDIWHPLLEDVGIKAVAVAERMQPEQTADGEWTIEIRFIEWRRPHFALAKPDGAEATQVDPVEEYKIKPLVNQLVNELDTSELLP